MTGYARCAYDERLTFPEFACMCGGAFGFLSEEFIVNRYDATKLEEAKAELAQWLTLTPLEQTDVVQKRCERIKESERKSLAITIKQNNYMLGLLSDVIGWNAPPELDALKTFMREQVSDSIFDTERLKERFFEPFNVSAMVAMETEKRQEAVNYHLKGIERETVFVAERNRLLRLLRVSLEVTCAP